MLFFLHGLLSCFSLPVNAQPDFIVSISYYDPKLLLRTHILTALSSKILIPFTFTLLDLMTLALTGETLVSPFFLIGTKLVL